MVPRNAQLRLKETMVQTTAAAGPTTAPNTISPAIPSRGAAVFRGIGQWIGEAAIGLIPLFVYELVHRFSSLPVTATCTKPPAAFGNANPPLVCTPIIESSSQEVCVLAVVISGLAVLSVVSLSQRHERRITGWTRILILFAVGALITGSLFYGLFTAHLDKDANTMVYYVLAMALISSFFLAVEGAVLEA